MTHESGTLSGSERSIKIALYRVPVHRGDLGGIKDIYRINPVDEVIRFQLMVHLERLPEFFLLTMLKPNLHRSLQYPYHDDLINFCHSPR
ncbi:MAG: hypothetical protein DSZ02_07470 [Gammaproteobacteria bacterium]|nr:MAG: hypothetical protein DSZ02_07470 [Gammaproteobacteria bacterium]